MNNDINLVNLLYQLQVSLPIKDATNWGHKDGPWWRASYSSLRRNHLNNELVDRHDATCGQMIEPRRNDLN